MPAGYSIHVGLVSVSNRLRPTLPRANGADNAAIGMREVAQQCGLAAEDPLLNRDVTKPRLRELFAQTAGRLQDGDLLLVTLAGHGEVHVSRDGEEVRNQAFLLFDSLLVDDEIYSWLATIQARASVVLVIDACYSGSMATPAPAPDLPTTLDRGMTRALFSPFEAAVVSSRDVIAPASEAGHDFVTCRLMPRTELSRYVTLNSGWRFAVLSQPAKPRPPLGADVTLLAASRDDAVASGLPPIGSRYPPFTDALLSTWADSSSYWDLLARIKAHAAGSFPEPVLNHRLLRDKAFLDRRPFRV